MVEMLFILLNWLLALFIFMTFGVAVFQLLGIAIDRHRPLYQFLLQVLAGIALTDTLFGLASLLMPVNANVTLALSVLAVGFMLLRSVRDRMKQVFDGFMALAWYSKTLFGVLALVLLFVSALPSLNYDTGLYHGQFIMWMNRYAAVPGLANLHERFGFNSHWHLLASGFNGYPYLTDLLNDMGTLLVVVFVLAAVASADALMRKREEPMFDALMVLSFLPLYLLARFLTSDTPDLPNAIIGYTVMTVPFYRSVSNPTRLSIMAIIGALLITIKVSSFLLLLVAVPSLANIKWKDLLRPLTLGLIVLGPWLIRNYTFSGYLVYPAKITAIGHPDFQAPVESLEYVNALLESHGKFGQYNTELVGRPVSEWGHLWLGHQTTAIKLMLILCFAFWLVFFPLDGYRAWRSKLGYAENVNLMVHVVFMASMLIVFKLAPEIRYAYGILLFYFVYMLVRTGLYRYRWPVLALGMVGVLMLTRIATVISKEPPAPVLSKTYQTMDGGALPIYYPTEFDQCWQHELPCTNRYIQGLEMRTDRLQDGFRIVR